MKIKGYWREVTYYTAEVEIDEDKLNSMSYYELKDYVQSKGEIIKTETYPNDDAHFHIAYS